MFSLYANYYYVVIGLQAICAIHCIRKGNQNRWIWLIIFLPLLGSLIYIFTEIFTRRGIEQVQSGVGAVFNPSGKIKTLQENLRFADTFNNRMALADAYLDAGQVDKAIELYEKSLTGTFIGNEQANMQLIIAYFEKRRFEDLITTAKKIYHLPQFVRSRAHMLYAISLGYTNNNEAAEKEFAFMKGRFSNYESRYHFGMFLKRSMRVEEAKKVFMEMLDESSHLSPNEKRNNRTWLNHAKEELKSSGSEKLKV
ncbi:MAG: PLDc N-terminal domain-containing protein [Ferruginibacter sp.]